MHESKMTVAKDGSSSPSKDSKIITTITTTSKSFSITKTQNSSTLAQRVHEFEKTARYMIKKLQDTRCKIDDSLAAQVDADTIEHLKMSVAPDAATLISQGDTLVLETHGSATSELATAVMEIQSILREKFREVQHAK